MSNIKTLTSLALSSFLFYCAFSRLTHGEYTPQMHAHQVDRSPDDGSTTATVIPFVDMLFAISVLIPRTRKVGATLCTGIMTLGMVMRRLEGKDPTIDGLITLGVFVSCMIFVKLDG